jgi:hypothetical protein
MTIYWTAENNSSFLNGHRSAKTLRGAVIAARRYIDGELYGEGTAYFRTAPDSCLDPIRIDSKSIFTGFKWVTTCR